MAGNDENRRSGPPSNLDSEIRIADHALASAIGRALGLRVEHKSFALILAEIKECAETVHDRLVAYLAAQHIYLRRLALADDVPSDESRHKLAAAGEVRDRQMHALRDAMRRHGLRQTGMVDLLAPDTEPELPNGHNAAADRSPAKQSVSIADNGHPSDPNDQE